MQVTKRSAMLNQRGSNVSTSKQQKGANKNKNISKIEKSSG
jgi:hypothetical protein